MNKQTLLDNLSCKLSTPSKMPGYTFALPAKDCITGGKLRTIAGSVCYGCYAHKGAYSYPKTKAVREHNLAIIRDSSKLVTWAIELSGFINTTKQKEFRFHDSGDIQSIEHLCAIVGIAKKCPDTKFWLPTKEYAFVSQYNKRFGAFPSNLCVRVSSPMLGQAPLKAYTCTSTVDSDSASFNCPVSDGKETCNTYKCRACWDNNVTNINYHKHQASYDVTKKGIVSRKNKEHVMQLNKLGPPTPERKQVFKNYAKSHGYTLGQVESLDLLRILALNMQATNERETKKGS